MAQDLALAMKRTLDKPSGSACATASKKHNTDVALSLRQDLLALHGASKSSLARVLAALNSRGILQDTSGQVWQERRYLTIANQSHASTETHYGTIVQKMFVPGLDPIEYINCLLYTSPSPRD